jgi:hypothetical protein
MVAGFRLPGWTGGRGFYFADGDTFVIAQMAGDRERSAVATWQPVRLRGRWRQDEWGGGWWQVEAVEGS